MAEDHDHSKLHDHYQLRRNMDGQRWNVVDTDATFCNVVSAGWSGQDAAQALADALNLGLTTPERVKQVDRDLRERGEPRELEGGLGLTSEGVKSLAEANKAEPPTYRY